MAASSIEKIKSLPALPSQATAIDQGQYTIATKQQLNLIPTNDEATRTHIWFRTPALTIDTIKHIRSIQLWAESRDQGANRERFYGNWTWFELAILENESSQEPKKVNDVEFVWKSHRNRFQATDFDWGEGQKFTEDQDLVHLLEVSGSGEDAPIWTMY
ncbi:hypothetical protein N0V91_007815 [Didymella pomorum]|uniref:Uncharacterized protein n=1 Tax=Didymella pomorum TaxID=749634 RepID=A0A9W8Z7Z8_9PLEO|nr:hypothetical protein N0V91_007815 [Didymella pomorum]